MRHSNDLCQNPKRNAFIYTTWTMDSIHGMNQPYTIQTSSLSRFKSQTPSQVQGNNKIPITAVTKPEKVNTVSDTTRHRHVRTNRCRKHHLHRRQINMGTTSKTTARELFFFLITTANRASHNNDRQPRKSNGMSSSTTRRPRRHQRVHPT